jgi:hypothetical protein
MVVTAVLVAQYAGTFDVADTTRFSLRASQPPPFAVAHVDGKAVNGEIVLAADASTALLSRLRLRLRQWDYSLGVTGSVSANDLEEQVVPLFLGGANATEAWHDRMVRVGFTESGSLGLVSAAVPYQQTAAASTMMPQPGMTGQPTMTGQPGAMQGQTSTPGTTALFGQPGNLTVGSYDLGGSVLWRASTRTSLAVQGGFSGNGGLDPASRMTLPEGYGPHASLSALTVFSRLDSTSLSLSYSDNITVGYCTLFASNTSDGECREEVPDGQLTASYRRKISATGAVSVSAGVAATVAATSTLNELVIVPTASVALAETVGHTAYALTTSLAPTVDFRTGLPSNRVMVTASLIDRVAPRTALNAAASVIQSLPFPTQDPFPLTLLTATVEAKFTVDRRTIVGFGLASFVQHQSQAGPTVGAPGGPEWGASEIAYVSVTAYTPTLHF